MGKSDTISVARYEPKNYGVRFSRVTFVAKLLKIPANISALSSSHWSLAMEGSADTAATPAHHKVYGRQGLDGD